MWFASMKDFPLASHEAGGAVEAYHLKLKSKLYDNDSQFGSLQRVDFLVHKLTTEIHSAHWLDRYADESGSFDSVKEEYISSTSWYRAHQIPDNSVKFFNQKGEIYAKVKSQKNLTKEHTVWNPGSEFAFCDCSWAMKGNLCKHSIKANLLLFEGREEEKDKFSSTSAQSFKKILEELWRQPMEDSVGLDLATAWAGQVLDQVRVLVELCNSGSIVSVVDNLPLKWVTKKGRTFTGKPPLQSVLALPPAKEIKSQSNPPKRNRKRKRISRLWG